MDKKAVPSHHHLTICCLLCIWFCSIYTRSTHFQFYVVQRRSGYYDYNIVVSAWTGYDVSHSVPEGDNLPCTVSWLTDEPQRGRFSSSNGKNIKKRPIVINSNTHKKWLDDNDVTRQSSSRLYIFRVIDTQNESLGKKLQFWGIYFKKKKIKKLI